MGRGGPISWTIDGWPVRMAPGWRANMVAPGGYDRFDGWADPSTLGWVGQGSIITAYKPGKVPLWQGRLSAPPKLRYGQLKLSGSGPRSILQKKRTRLPYQLRGYTQWFWAGGDPAGITGLNQDIAFATADGSLVFTVGDNTAVTNGDVNQGALWVPKNPISSIGMSLTQSVTTSNWELRIYSGIGPAGPLTQRYSQALNGSLTITVPLQTIDTDDDMVAIGLVRTGVTGNTSINYSITITALRTNWLTDVDSMSSSEVLTDMAARAGFDTLGIQPTGVNVLPQDWTSPGWDGFADYICSLEDRVWLALEDRGATRGQGGRGFAFDAGPWGFGRDPWVIATERDADEDLDELELFNHLAVDYVTTSGAPAELVLDANPDPLAGSGIDNTYYVDLTGDPQPDDTLPNTVAASVLPRVSSQQVQGRITVAELEAPDGSIVSPYDLRAGDLCRIRDFRPTLPPQRVVGVEYTYPGPIQADVGRDVTPDGLIAAGLLARSRV